MRQYIRSVINVTTILSSYIGAIGYGVGYNLPNKLNWHPIICIVCCLVLGTLFDKLAKKILSSKFFNESKRNKIIVATCIYSSYLIAWLIVDYALNYDLDKDFLLNLGFVLLFQLIILVIKVIKKYIKDKKDNQQT